MTRFEAADPDVVVVVGSGAGGGTLANELCQAGVRVVCLEAGPHLTGPDYHNDEWPAFHQMAWTDLRTTSGSWRVAKDFPHLPAWTVKAVGGTSTHWAGACPRFKAHEFTTKGSYGAVEGPRCSTGRSPWPTSSRTTTTPRSGWASPTGTAARRCPPTTTTRCWPTARRRSATGSTPPGRTPPTPRPTMAARRATRTASTSRATRPARSGRRWSPSCPRRRRPATWTCARTATPRRSRTTRPGGSTGSCTSRARGCTGRRPGWSAWRPAFTEIMDGYENTAGPWIVGEDMPQSTNRVTLNGDATDQHGLPVPNVHFDDHPNDVAMRSHAWEHAAELYRAVGAVGVTDTPPYPSTHNLGTCRMSADPAQGVVDRFGRAHDVPNLYVSDGSVFTTGAAANPTLTIVALAVRQAEHIVGQLKAGVL